MAGSSLLTLLDDIAMLLDDVAVLSKVAAKKTAGVLGDDLAVNAEQLSGKGISASRELPVVWSVFKGSLLNKLIIVPVALLLSFYLPWIITPLLMIGGAYLCYEGSEKVWHYFASKKERGDKHKELLKAMEDPNLDIKEFEKEKIKGAIRMDFILSAEIVIIALGSMSEATIEKQIIALSFIAIAMTIGVYGLVAAIVRMDDWGLELMKDKSDKFLSKMKKNIGSAMVSLSPKLMKTLTFVGTIAMFLVGAPLLFHGVPALEVLIKDINLAASNINFGLSILSGISINMIGGFIIGAFFMMIHHLYSKLKG